MGNPMTEPHAFLGKDGHGCVRCGFASDNMIHSAVHPEVQAEMQGEVKVSHANDVVRPNYYRQRVRVREIMSSGTPRVEIRASLEVELECQDLIEALRLNFNEGNVLKYLFRAGKKSPERHEDLKKVLTYAGFAVTDSERNGGK